MENNKFFKNHTDLLNKQISGEYGKRIIKEISIPDYVKNNLKYPMFEWQEEAFKYFLQYENSAFLTNPSHLMFNLATGSGKTLLMAGLILYYYKKGYRHFLFLVNTKNVVSKTEENFLNKSHNKYLFSENIIVDNKNIEMKKVDYFSDAQDEVIQIKFSTIQKIYNEVHKIRENTNHLGDYYKKNIIILADEAHHLNSSTKDLKKIQERSALAKEEELKDNANQDKIEALGWEHTVNELIFKKNNQNIENKNVLLEFTATIPEIKEVQEKYLDKTIYCFDVKDFLAKGYTKTLNLISSNETDEEDYKRNKILLSLIFNWYRHEIAIKYNIPNFKGVILFRSKTIDEGTKDFEYFKQLVENLKEEDKKDFDKILGSISENENNNYTVRRKQIYDYIKEKSSYSSIVKYIKLNFKDENLIITNSKTKNGNKEEITNKEEFLLNSLENVDNPIRAVFTVKKLTEGWDVLNLFDIVRLYKGQSEGGSNKKKSSSTTQEIQLIGRGLRYYPFKWQDSQNEILHENKRKFEEGSHHELAVLEEMFYHSEGSEYLSSFKKHLKEEGYLNDDKKTIEFDIKEEIRSNEFFQSLGIYINKLKPNPNKQKNTLESIKENFQLECKILKDGSISQDTFSAEEGGFKIVNNSNKSDNSSEDNICFDNIANRHILRKAISLNEKKFLFNNIKEFFQINEIEDLLKEEFFGKLKILIEKEKTEEISAKDRLKITQQVVNKIFHFI